MLCANRMLMTIWSDLIRLVLSRRTASVYATACILLQSRQHCIVKRDINFIVTVVVWAVVSGGTSFTFYVHVYVITSNRFWLYYKLPRTRCFDWQSAAWQCILAICDLQQVYIVACFLVNRLIYSFTFYIIDLIIVPVIWSSVAAVAIELHNHIKIARKLNWLFVHTYSCYVRFGFFVLKELLLRQQLSSL